MNAITRTALEALPVVPYSGIRPELRTGDLMMMSGAYFASRFIRYFGDSPFSHVGVIFRLDDLDRVILSESVETHGVRLVPTSAYVRDFEGSGEPYDGVVLIARNLDFEPGLAKAAAQVAIDRLTTPYGYGQIARIFARMALGLSTAKHEESLVCSEWAARIALAFGVWFAPGESGYVTPGDIWLHPRTELVARVV